VRIVPLSEDIKEVILPLVRKKGTDDLVFHSCSGGASNDRIFQGRVFFVVLKGLKFPHRVFYDCIHTYGFACV
jgi:hypothetical protein